MDPTSSHHDGLHYAGAPAHEGLQTNGDGLEVPQTYWNQHLPKTIIHDFEDERSGTKREKGKTLCGIPVTAFWLLLALIIGLIIAVAVVGGVLGSRHTSSSATNPSLTATKTLPPTTATFTTTAATVSETSNFECTANGTTYQASTGSIFRTLCNQDMKPMNSSVDVDIDAVSLNTHTFGACMDACALWTLEGIEGGPCNAVAFVDAGSGAGSCYLKTGDPKAIYSEFVMSARLTDK